MTLGSVRLECQTASFGIYSEEEAMKQLLILSLAVLLAACVSISVKPVDSKVSIQHVCIEDNPKVVVSDFMQALRDGFDRNGISSEIYTGTKSTNCEYQVTYTANKKWALAGFYLSHAEIRIEKDGRYVASATYNSKGLANGSFTTTKEAIDPVMDEMLKKSP